MTTDTLDYEAQRLQNIKDNEALLLSLGLAVPTAKPVTKTAPRKSVPTKRKQADTDADLFTPPADEEQASTSNAKSAKAKRPSVPTRVSETGMGTDGSPLRRSGRDRRSISRLGTEFDFEGSTGSPSGRSAPSPAKRVYADDGDREPLRVAKKLGVRTQDPKQFGHIPDVEVGRCWPTRIECSTDAIHAPTVAGISGNPHDGAWSIALSGGYPDDVDLGVAFTYTGCGGRDLKGTKQNPKNLRTAEQTSDQSFDWPLNAAIKRSAETKKPVRVIRGYKLPSPYAPAEGYRYDGLYVVEKAWMARGLTKGLMVCRYAFKRLPGQPPLPQRDTEAEAEAEVDAAEQA